jgi:ABC-type Zn uptake system ZnuABC Zn-binding protein ZnuA
MTLLHIQPNSKIKPLLFSSLLFLSSAQASAKTTVVVSFQPYYTLVKNIAADKLEVVLLLPPGASPHTFDPTPSDLKKVVKAKLAFMNGLKIDDWLSSLVKNSGSSAKIIQFGTALNYPKRAPLDPDEGAFDPHIWLDASIMQKAAQKIGAELAQTDPQNAALYLKNAALEGKKLQALHLELQHDLAGIKGKPVVTFHGAWTYFAAAYGLNVAAAVEPFPGKEPSAKYIRDVVDLLKKQKIKVIFAEPTLPQAPAQAIADSAGAKLYILTPEGSSSVKDYYAMMRQNKEVLLEALK